MNRILYISLTGMTEPLGRSQVLEYLIDLTKKENKFYLISFERDKDFNQIEEIKKIIKKYDIEWHYFIYSNRYGIFSTINQLFKSIKLGKKISKKENINIIHARSFIPTVMGYFIKKLTDNTKLLFDFRGFSTAEKVDRGRVKKGSILYKALLFLEEVMIKKSDALNTLTFKGKEILEREYDKRDIEVIPTCTNREIFKVLSEKDKESFKKRLGYKKEDIILIHTGTVSGWYDYDKELKVIKYLMQNDRNIKYLVLNKNEIDFIYKKLEEFNIDKERVEVTSADFNEIYKYLNIANFSIFFIKPLFSKQFSAPTKFAENVACYLPSITNRGVGDMEFYLDRYKVGKLVDLENIDYAEIFDFVNNRETYIDKKDFDELFNSYFDKKIAVEKYNNIYKRIVSEE